MALAAAEASEGGEGLGGSKTQMLRAVAPCGRRDGLALLHCPLDRCRWKLQLRLRFALHGSMINGNSATGNVSATSMDLLGHWPLLAFTLTIAAWGHRCPGIYLTKSGG